MQTLTQPLTQTQKYDWDSAIGIAEDIAKSFPMSEQLKRAIAIELIRNTVRSFVTASRRCGDCMAVQEVRGKVMNEMQNRVSELEMLLAIQCA